MLTELVPLRILSGSMQIVTSSSESFASWVAREILPHEASLRLWLRRRLRNASDVEDVIQECYCRLGEIEDKAAIKSPRFYVFTMAKNCILQEIRRSKIVRIDTMSEFDSQDLVSEAPSPERVVAGRTELDRVLALIADLPPRARQIVEMRKIYGLSQKEIAQRLGVSINVVENEASRGLKHILAQLTRPEPQPDQPMAMDDERPRFPRHY